MPGIQGLNLGLTQYSGTRLMQSRPGTEVRAWYHLSDRSIYIPGGPAINNPPPERDPHLDALLGVFRTHGYDGASLSMLSDAAGLRRASLYHRYPGGKEQMAEAVIEHVAAIFNKSVVEPIRADADPATRVRLVAQRLTEFYGSGERPCILDALSLGRDGSSHADALQRLYLAWREAFAAIARDAGATRTDADRRAARAITLIEGGLIVSRVSGDRRVFLNVMEELPALLTEPRPA